MLPLASQMGGEVEGIAHDARVRSPYDGDRHVVSNRIECAFDDLS